ncbi:M23 family metallopeptidase [Streptomyces sp. NPDC056411]|uniref:M23 family metallopeptidase n=1 Tax=Streptomyces sp. NPDC056411 TaxID=3345813 RepID=UPI0035DB3113
MNDRHPSEGPLPTDSASDASYAHYPAYDSYGQQYSPAHGAEYSDGDPLFGSPAGAYGTGGYDNGAYDTGGYDTAGYQGGGYTGGPYGAAPDSGTYDTGAYDTGTYDALSYGTGNYGADAYDTGSYPTAAGDGYGAGGYDTGTYASTQWGTGSYDTGATAYDPYAHTAYDPAAQDPAGYAGTSYGHGVWDTGSHPAGGYDTGAFETTGAYGTVGAYDTAGTHNIHEAHTMVGGFETIGRQATAVEEHADFGSTAQETADHEATAIWSTSDQGLIAGIPAQAGPPPTDTVVWDSTSWEAGALHDDGAPGDTDGPGEAAGTESDRFAGSDAAAVADAMTQAMPITPAAPTGRRVAGPAPGKAVRGRGRRRPAKRSALLTVAVPSVAALGVCGVAAASVANFGGDEKDDTTTQAAADTSGVKPATANRKLDTQLASLSASADDFRDRASRTQERIDLKERQALERKRKAEEAARKEAMRPKFVLPVTQHGLSALFGQAGVNWMSVHTGIDFPVSYGTPVRAATDGTVRTQWNSAYGNMAIVTAPDGTETWYCHLSSTKIRSGSVKAGDQIAYSGNSGNSTGPHLHFEVRPGGGAAVDPLPWLRSHGLNPN